MNATTLPDGAAPLRLEYLDAGQLDEHPDNWKYHSPDQINALDAFVGDVGWAGALLLNERTGRLLDGHARRAMGRNVGARVPVLVGSWTEEQERKILRFLDPLGWASVADKSKVDALFAGVELPQIDDPIFSGLVDAIQAEARTIGPDGAEAADGPTDPADAARPDDPADAVVIPFDSKWPSGNLWDIPDLLPELMATECPYPVVCWGSQGARKPMAGTWHCYTADSKFEPLWKRPGRLLLSRPAAVVEPNFSTTDQTPFVYSLHQIYRKRWLARWWQSQGLRVFVDLNVEGELNDPHDATGGQAPNLLGVPLGWTAYATRAHADRPENLVREYEVAARHADGRTPLFVVVGGGKAVKALCRARTWIHVPEQIETRRRASAEESTE